MLPHIYPRFPNDYERYIEVFGGSGAVLFGKKKENFEVYNDFNVHLVNLFRVVKEKPFEFLKEFHFLNLNSRDDFNQLLIFLNEKEHHDYYIKNVSLAKGMLDELKAKEVEAIFNKRANELDVKQAVAFFKLVRYSYGANTKTYGSHPVTLAEINNVIQCCSERLQGVVVENKDFIDLIQQYDREKSFFYCDPPYVDTEGVYTVDVSKDLHQKLFEKLKDIRGMFLLSYNDCPYIRELYKDYSIYETKRINNLALRYGGDDFPELLIANYDISRIKSNYYDQVDMLDLLCTTDEEEEQDDRKNQG